MKMEKAQEHDFTKISGLVAPAPGCRMRQPLPVWRQPFSPNRQSFKMGCQKIDKRPHLGPAVAGQTGGRGAQQPTFGRQVPGHNAGVGRFAKAHADVKGVIGQRRRVDQCDSVAKNKIGGDSLAEDCKRIEVVSWLLGPG